MAKEYYSEIDFTPYNTRFPLMWNQLRKYVDFRNMSFVDLGCGGGDMVRAVSRIEGTNCIGIDKNIDREKIKPKSNISWIDGDLNDVNRYMGLLINSADIVSCFSVLPYLDNYIGLLRKMAVWVPYSLIEMQYSGDGPGPKDIENDEDMERLLYSCGYVLVYWIGQTHLEIRDASRSIWLCLGSADRPTRYTTDYNYLRYHAIHGGLVYVR